MIINGSKIKINRLSFKIINYERIIALTLGLFSYF